jgi:uracil phosphoribosyltransferase
LRYIYILLTFIFMLHTTNFSQNNSLINQFIAQLRDVNIQSDRMRFRYNLKKIGQIMAYEISKTLNYSPAEVETPFGFCQVAQLNSQPIVATIMRAGLPMHEGMLDFFDAADNAFVSAYRRHHKDGSFEVAVEYVSCPMINDRDLILCDPMLATGSSIVMTIKELLKHGQPASVHIAVAVASQEGVDYLRRQLPFAHLWVCAIDEELTAKSYIVPGLGDAGDLAYGAKSIE